MSDEKTHWQMAGRTFLYFAYGSNILRERLQLRNPSAIFKSIAKLQGYKLAFATDTDPSRSRWRGAGATIQEDPIGHVWGTVWEMNVDDLPSLDRQEAAYDSLDVEVTTWPDDVTVVCRTYKDGELEFPV
ncbi:hypothetical protein ScPMuIL_001780 [Solemya velum]